MAVATATCKPQASTRSQDGYRRWRMRIAPIADDLIEWIAIRANLSPVPLAAVVYGMPAARTLAVAQRLGILARLAQHPCTADEVAGHLDLQPVPTRLLLDALVGARTLRRDAEDRYALGRRARRWLDPASPRSVNGYLDHTAEYWAWWADLERVVREGGSFEIHGAPAQDPAWRRYVVGQHELARLSAADVARAIRLPPNPQRLLDVGGAHGTFAAELCRRHPTLHATVVDLPGSAAVGRELVAASGMGGRVTHQDGDMFTADLGGPYDAALCFDVVHHLQPAQVVALFTRIRAALEPGGTLAVLDLWRSASKRPRASAAFLGLFFHLTSGADLHSPSDLARHLREAGFGTPRRVRLRRLPDQRLYLARAD